MGINHPPGVSRVREFVPERQRPRQKCPPVLQLTANILQPRSCSRGCDVQLIAIGAFDLYQRDPRRHGSTEVCNQLQRTHSIFLAAGPPSGAPPVVAACALPDSCVAQASAGEPGEPRPAETGESPAPTPSSVPAVGDSVCEALAAAAAENDLPIDFFTRLIWQESRFDPAAVSRAGAQGVAQLPTEAAWRQPGAAADRAPARRKRRSMLAHNFLSAAELGMMERGGRALRNWSVRWQRCSCFAAFRDPARPRSPSAWKRTARSR